jgi:putative spermidine/putrescine transport system permease protein
MTLTRFAKVTLAAAAGLVIVVLYGPLVVIAIQSLNSSRSGSWPPTGLTFKWWADAWGKAGWKDALRYSLTVATVATALALVLGTLASFAVYRFKFFGRNVVSFLVVLPIALPGIVTGIALHSAFDRLDISLGFLTIVVGHATFCIVVVYNNVIARLRRSAPNIEEASADLGANPFQTFAHITFPVLRTAMLAGAMLAFALSFDEVVVTTFTSGARQTLPRWILDNVFRGKQVTVVNVVATAVVLLSIIPVWVVQRLTDGGSGGR